jgi:hypothetical protein
VAPRRAGTVNNQTPTCLSTAQGCVATGTHCVSPNGCTLQGTPSSQPTSVTVTKYQKPAQPQDPDQLPAAASDDKDDATHNDYNVDDTTTAHFLFLIPPHNQDLNASAPTQAGAHVENAENAQVLSASSGCMQKIDS